MRFPSFIKLPRHRRFEITPRYYDPIKEEIEERTRRIKEEMDGNPSGYRPSHIQFDRKTKSGPTSSGLQLIIAAGLGTVTLGWLYFGNQIFYTLWIIVPFYLFFRLRKSSRK